MRLFQHSSDVSNASLHFCLMSAWWGGGNGQLLVQAHVRYQHGWTCVQDDRQRRSPAVAFSHHCCGRASTRGSSREPTQWVFIWPSLPRRQEVLEEVWSTHSLPPRNETRQSTELPMGVLFLKSRLCFDNSSVRTWPLRCVFYVPGTHLVFT